MIRETAPETQARWLAWPAASFAPETELELGLSVVAVWRPADDSSRYSRASRATVYGARTTLAQSVVSGRLAWFAGKKWYVFAYLAGNDFPEYYYPDPRETTRAVFRNQYFRYKARLLRVAREKYFFGVNLAGRAHQIEWTEKQPSEQSLPGAGGGVFYGGGLTFLADTRDNVLFPESGLFLRLESEHSPRFFAANDFAFSRAELDLRCYRRTGWSGGLFAARFLAGWSGNEPPPFFASYRLGGAERLRGLHANRYLGARRALAQAAFRRMVFPRWGGAVFAGAGAVSEIPGRPAEGLVLWSAGAGVRFKVFKDSALNLRLDAGFNGAGGRGLYFGAGEAF